jgi:UDP-N-acetyl-D-mannosaminuronate dehydrogenase
MNGIAIIGNGEIGSSLVRVYQAKGITPMIKDLDLDTINDSVRILNICLPYSDKFIEITNQYISKYQPELTIVHSTVPVGTTKEIKGLCVHSPVRGVHPNLKEGIETFTKFIGYNDLKSLEIARDHYAELKIETVEVESTDSSELAKLTSTTYYGLCIAWHGEMKKMCEKYNVNFDVINQWTESYNSGYDILNMQHVIRPNLFPPKDGIGGHCVIPNTEILNESFKSLAFDLILQYKKQD